jgi:hypothetical protein
MPSGRSGVSSYIHPPLKGVTSRHPKPEGKGVKSDGSDTPHGSRVFSVEVGYQFRGIDEVPELPGVVLHPEVLPFD